MQNGVVECFTTRDSTETILVFPTLSTQVTQIFGNVKNRPFMRLPFFRNLRANSIFSRCIINGVTIHPNCIPNPPRKIVFVRLICLILGRLQYIFTDRNERIENLRRPDGLRCHILNGLGDPFWPIGNDDREGHFPPRFRDIPCRIIDYLGRHRIQPPTLTNSHHLWPRRGAFSANAV